MYQIICSIKNLRIYDTKSEFEFVNLWIFQATQNKKPDSDLHKYKFKSQT